VGPPPRHRADPVQLLSGHAATALRRGRVLRDLVAFARSGPSSIADPPPLVTVIIPTYNYSSVLRHAIRSVLRQTYPSFELLVVGDGCTDDSEEVTASFGDPRVTWLNLEENSGSQAAPNNAAVERAAGRYVAYLGHDDLWHPWHLAAVVGELERAEAPFGHGLVELVGPPGSRRKVLSGVMPGDRPLGRWVAPTSLVHLTEVGRRVRWRDHTEASDTIDIDYFDRVQREVGPPLRVVALTGFKFVSTWRPNCYADRPDHEQADWSHRLETEPHLLERELLELLFHRLSPFHGKLPPEPVPPPDAQRGPWLAARARRIRGLE
jgi:glycosyltransferase involved in cell wall biosynthesis